MNNELKSLVEGAQDTLPIRVVNSTDEYHSLPIGGSVVHSGFDKVYGSDGGAIYLGKYKHPLPGVCYMNHPIDFNDAYNRILDFMDEEFGENIRRDGFVTVTWNDLLSKYLRHDKTMEFTIRELEQDPEIIYGTTQALREEISINLSTFNAAKEQKIIDKALKYSKLNLLAVRPQDVLCIYAFDKFNPRLTPTTELVFDIGVSDLKPKTGGIYNAPGTALHFDKYRPAMRQISDIVPELVQTACERTTEEKPDKLNIDIPWVVVLESVDTPGALVELQSAREPISRLLSPQFDPGHRLIDEAQKVAYGNFDSVPEINIGTHLVFAGVGELEKCQGTLTSLGTNFWSDYNTNPESPYRDFLAPFVEKGLVHVLRSEELIPIELTEYVFDKNAMLSCDGVPEISASLTQTANA
ncbi:MAG: hypothetical protein KAI53_05475 [Candidatus Aenigmarchaeota archaeon]|nr:hypothetical protein [Candidatus Aenigmarchaeota archaeon]